MTAARLIILSLFLAGCTWPEAPGESDCGKWTPRGELICLIGCDNKSAVSSIKTEAVGNIEFIGDTNHIPARGEMSCFDFACEPGADGTLIALPVGSVVSVRCRGEQQT